MFVQEGQIKKKKILFAFIINPVWGWDDKTTNKSNKMYTRQTAVWTDRFLICDNVNLYLLSNLHNGR